MTFVLITIFILLPYLALIFYYRNSWISMKDYVPGKILGRNELPFISIIIAARNEEKNIENCLQSLFVQSYPQIRFEIIVTDDHSTDNTVSIINSFHNEQVRVINLSDFTKDKTLNSYKKKSIETALQFAKGSLIVTTDADCIAPPKWLETLAFFYNEKNPVFVALPVSFIDYLPGDSFFNKAFTIFQILDFMTLQGITGASVNKQFHNMCNGANLAYEKRVFNEVGGFQGIDNIASGDDMLLMQKIQNVYPDQIMFLKSPEVIMQTQSSKTLKEFKNQRIRWASKANKYTDKKIATALLLVYLFNAWIFILGVSSFFYVKAFYLFLISIILKTIVELVFIYPVAKFFGKQKLLWWFAPVQPFHIFYTLIAGWLGMFGSYQWKGRKVK
ncbi:MAG: glycosyltransferase [Bacteroidota bacterium]|nr:glycosyltransferase [Bacteroidota bacterium]